ncbi:hypothetical protein HDV02_004889 [Globomyces sp. JEL0801]|nr:hypothetical protein HDV02_004889 [Globomyces sp. JEL0801]
MNNCSSGVLWASLSSQCPPHFYCPLSNNYSELCQPDPICLASRLQSTLNPSPCSPQSPLEPMLCPNSTYCPSPNVSIPCPANHFCPAGSINPVKCSFFSYCPASSHYEQFYGGILLIAIIDSLLLVLYLYSKYSLQIHKYFNALFIKPVTTSRHTPTNDGMTTDKKSNDINDRSSDNQQSPLLENHDKITITEMPLKRSRSYIPKPINIINAFIESRLNSNATIKIQFSDLSFELPNGLKILQGVSGEFHPGKFTAIMGPSGAGKTTFLNVLLGKIQGTSGKVIINDCEGSLADLKKVVGFVPQQDIMLPELTVRENIYHSCRTRAPRAWSNEKINDYVDKLLHVLSLSHVADSLIGNHEMRGISGGQRKRVNVGMELASLPLSLFLDEPTSGLDATASLNIVNLLKNLAELNLTTVAVIHQPRIEIYDQLDDILLLIPGGRTAYLGPKDYIEEYFGKFGYEFCPSKNPADILMDIVSHRTKPREGFRNLSPSDLAEKWEAFKTNSQTNDGQPQQRKIFRVKTKETDGPEHTLTLKTHLPKDQVREDNERLARATFSLSRQKSLNRHRSVNDAKGATDEALNLLHNDESNRLKNETETDRLNYPQSNESDASDIIQLQSLTNANTNLNRTLSRYTRKPTSLDRHFFNNERTQITQPKRLFLDAISDAQCSGTLNRETKFKSWTPTYERRKSMVVLPTVNNIFDVEVSLAKLKQSEPEPSTTPRDRRNSILVLPIADGISYKDIGPVMLDNSPICINPNLVVYPIPNDATYDDIMAELDENIEDDIKDMQHTDLLVQDPTVVLAVMQKDISKVTRRQLLELCETRHAGFLTQLWICTVRSFLQQYRQVDSFCLEMFIPSVCGILQGISLQYLAGSPYRGTLVKPLDIISPASMETRLTESIFAISMVVSFAAAPASCNVFGMEKLVYYREAASGHQSLAYFLAKTLAALPRIALGALHMVAFFTPLIGPRTAFGTLYIMILLLFYCIFGIGSIISIIRDRDNQHILATLLAVIPAVYCGHDPSLTDSSPFTQFLLAISFNRYFGELYYSNEVVPYRGIYQVDDISAKLTGFVLERPWFDLGMMFVIGGVLRVIAYICLIGVNRAKQR